MKKFYPEITYKLQEDLNDLEINGNYSMHQIEMIIDVILKCLAELKAFVLKKGFKDIEEEIRFFKYQKPKIVSKLIYYNAVYKIESKKPYGEKAIKKYLNNELKKLRRYFDNNLEFYKYYRTNNTVIDDKLFVRRKHDIKLTIDTFYFEADHNFSTTHDFKAAKIIANDLIQVYIEDEILNTSSKGKSNDLPSLTWKGSKTALTELIYSLHAQGVFDNTDIKVIAKTFEAAFNIDLGDFYHTYMELKSRKINRSKFLDSLRESLIKRMDDQEDV